jgi:hypothetical protein
MDKIRCIVVNPSEKYPDGLIRINHCFGCVSHEITDHKIDRKQWCYLLQRIYRCPYDDKRIKIKDSDQILSKCPLPLYDRMRWYGPEEVPEENRDVEIKLNFPNINENKDYIIRIGFYEKKSNTWTLHDSGQMTEMDCVFSVVEQIIFWRYL